MRVLSACRRHFLPCIPHLKSVTKSLEPQRHADTTFFPGLPGLRPADKKRLPLCLRVFVVQGFYAFCDTLEAGDDGRYLFHDPFTFALRNGVNVAKACIFLSCESYLRMIPKVHFSGY